ncbi:MAG: D-2-hydroxyacid dehydrogenase, partial [Marinobacter sp.]|uniref:D-2-hydroxyacid dehydrogenase n=1 Tax=Marinobacter sp. TaxID=50741 RepID=UPI00396D18BB
MTEVLVLTAPDEPALPGLDGLPDDIRVTHVREEDELRNGLQRADILVVTDFRSGMLARCWPEDPSVQWVHATSAGVDALMFPALTDSGIPVTNARGVFDRGIAEYVLGAVLMFAKDTLGNLRYQSEHRWVHRDTALIREQRALVVGAGSIGTTTARLLSAAGMRVTGIARSARDVEGFEAVHAQDRLADCLAESDHVVITAPLTPETEGLFDESMLRKMKPGACLINVGRGPIVRTDDLVAVLRSGHLGGAALDVFEEEPLPEDHPLWDRPEVMISAHMAGDFIGWRRALG